MAEQPKLIVIGAGIAGLSTGVHAARCGFDVQIVEHHPEPGGVCTGWTHGDYTIDGCIHWLMGARADDPLHRLYEEVGALDGVELQILDCYTQIIDEVTGHQLTFSRDLDVLLREVEALSPHDLPVFRELVELSRRTHGMPMPMESPRGLVAGLREAWRGREALLLMLRHHESMAAFIERIRHPSLQQALAAALPSEMPVFFAAFLLGSLETGNLATIVGGSQRFSQAIARRFTELGGKLRYGADVIEILVEDDRAVGVRLADGDELRADHVVSAAPGPTTIFRMLGGRYTDAAIRKRQATWPMFGGICMTRFGLRAQWHERPRALHLRLAEPFVLGPDRIAALGVRNTVYDPSLAPPGCSVIQVLHEGNFDFWHDVHHAPLRYRELKHELGKQLSDRLERWYPGFGEAVEFVDVATPYTFWRYARSYRGAYEGWLPTAETMGKHLPKQLPGLRRFHMAGQWVEPGGGVPPAVSSGREVVRLVCEEHERPFVEP